ncbi:hypothetical protein TSACC_3671 [Terrimicrobium sacchariphilum]|uniref:Uncharacterized protein n=1 Tax=Terrimicrobium sacchariphilum TaxID=690879 RepID=A0A146GE79_TERSA|nr:DUF2303 family protein [Terrimicrobium sacchariphilum]GAT35600.1 hypothetical protein TSACC_3671 [Terrimicrobium sacchariphilum]
MSVIETLPEATTNAAAGFLAGLGANVRVEGIEGIPHLINPASGELKNLEHLLEAPKRLPQKREVATLEAFNEYVKRFKSADSSIYVTANSTGYVITAELDHRSETKLAWHDHRVSFNVTHSEPLRKWIDSNSRQLAQARFAEFLEERSREIKEPSAAEILELAQELHVTRNLSVKSIVRGSRASNTLSFNQEQSLKGGKAGVDLPNSFTVELEPFKRHRERTQIKAFLRPRIDEDKPVFTYELQLVEEAIEEALNVILGAIATQTGLPVYR